jgi:hypothetical protein
LVCHWCGSACKFDILWMWCTLKKHMWNFGLLHIWTKWHNQGTSWRASWGHSTTFMVKKTNNKHKILKLHVSYILTTYELNIFLSKMASMNLQWNFAQIIVFHWLNMWWTKNWVPRSLSYVDATNVAFILAKAHGGGATNGHYEVWSCFLTNCVKVWNFLMLDLPPRWCGNYYIFLNR